MSGAGSLTERVAFDRRVQVNPDFPHDYGNTEDDWQEQFQCAAEYIHVGRGTESVMQARLGGIHTQVIRVRASSLTRALATDWRVRDVRRGTVFNIRDVTLDPGRAWVDVLAQSGVAT